MYSNNPNNNNNVGGNVPGGAGDDDSDESGSGGWISWFCDLEGHEFFIEVSKVLSMIALAKAR
jgi:hypothetical protein